MKKILLFAIILMFPQNLFAEAESDFSFFGSWESRGALQKNETPVAETYPGIEYPEQTTTQAVVTPITAAPVYLHLKDTHYFKTGAGFKWRGFDLGAYYTSFSTDYRLEDKFKNTFPLSTGSNSYAGSDQNENMFTPFAYGTEHVEGLAKGQFDFEHIDLEAGALFKVELISIRLSAGVRYAKYNQSLNVKTTGARDCAYGDWDGHEPTVRNCRNPDNVVDATDQQRFEGPSHSNSRQLDMDIEALGPRIGLSVGVPLSKNITFVGGVNWAILFGKKNITDDYESTSTRRQIAANGWSREQTDEVTDSSGNVVTAQIDATEYIEGEPIVLEIEQGGYKVKDKDETIHNVELEAGLRYDIELSDSTTLSFLAGYRYDMHYGVRTTCGSSKSADTEQASYGKCAERNLDGSIDHESEDFISHGPFLRTTFSF